MDLKKKGEIFENNNGNLIFVCCICDATNVGLMDVENHLKTHIDLVVLGDIAAGTEPDICLKTELISTGIEDENEAFVKYEPHPHSEGYNKDLIDVPTALSLQGNDVPQPNYGTQVTDYTNISKIHDHKLINIPKNIEKPSRRFYPVFYQCKCDICNHIYSSKRYLKVHIYAKHMGILRNECYICGHRFADRMNLKEHIDRHNNIKRHSCDVCGRAFVTPTELKRHKSSHMVEKNCVCSICGARYGHITYLRSHEIRVHINDRQHKCDFQGCNRTFLRPSNLKVHMRCHSGERPLNCDICKKDFANPKVLRNHKLLHSEHKKYPCKFCPSKFTQSSGRRGHERRVHGAV